ncbi:acyltransferase-like protein [Mangrovibacterium marinum]|uniref:Acyltransferase-like protein n=2 Tax=Mangrovibacterium marinum TaxID=1639118 RepID=A0A2T5BYC4_9BACT|nr:acyltransferase-like protein [Mangrovibacterium marinum]
MCFDDIRPYEDQEVNHYLNVLLKDDLFRQVLFFIFNDEQKVNEISAMLAKVKNKRELQLQFMYPLIEDWIIKRTTSGVSYSGLENLDKSKAYLFISNHRDIILDSAILNYIVVAAGMNTTEIAIGNNLLIYDWIQHIVKLNGAFVVKRNLPARELLTASKTLSAYIRKTITEDNVSVWIAQREGRTKDGCDQTQQALLKMLNLSNKADFASGFRELQIVPLSISYEREPCGISKVEEIYKKEHEGYVKTQADDLKSMAFGLTRPKGRVHFAFGKPIDAQLDEIAKSENPQESIQKLADQIDACIYRNYKLWPYNYLAADMLDGKTKQNGEIEESCRAKFSELLDDMVATIGQGDPECQKRLFMQMYANPLLNKEKVAKSKILS